MSRCIREDANFEYFQKASLDAQLRARSYYRFFEVLLADIAHSASKPNEPIPVNANVQSCRIRLFAPKCSQSNGSMLSPITADASAP